MPKRKHPNESLAARVGARIRFLRLEQNLSLHELASRAKCSADGLMEIELGRSTVSTRTLQKIAEALKVRPFQLLNHETETDDVGYIIETMRKHPKMFQTIAAVCRKTA